MRTARLSNISMEQKILYNLINEIFTHKKNQNKTKNVTIAYTVISITNISIAPCK
jgi:hypothetical protein